MRNTPQLSKERRLGAIAPLAAVLLIPLLGLVAFAIDYGYLLMVRADLQRSADAAALACVVDLLPDENDNQDLDAVRSRAREYAALNMDDVAFSVPDGDIEMGRYDTTTVYSSVDLLDAGTYDTVRVTLRRDSQANSPVSLFLAPLIGVDTADVSVSATAVMQKGYMLEPGADILPFAVPQAAWDAQDIGDEWSIYGDSKLEDEFGNTIPGNWGTVDIGATNNSTADLRDQINQGLRQSDLDALYADGRISTDEFIDGSEPAWMQADTGLSSGIKSAVIAAHGTTRLVPIYDSFGGSFNGNNLEFHIVKWDVVTLVTSNWQGSKNTYVTVMKSYSYDGHLRPNPDLSSTDDSIEGAFTVPALVE